jgi:hypothetical protein
MLANATVALFGSAMGYARASILVVIACAFSCAIEKTSYQLCVFNAEISAR